MWPLELNVIVTIFKSTLSFTTNIGLGLYSGLFVWTISDEGKEKFYDFDTWSWSVGSERRALTEWKSSADVSGVSDESAAA
jgi:hypothetical protein